MNAAPEYSMQQRHQPPASENSDEGTQHFWHWIAVAVLLVCWIAEASMCALRGF